MKCNEVCYCSGKNAECIITCVKCVTVFNSFFMYILETVSVESEVLINNSWLILKCMQSIIEDQRV
jgi:hypothetical protein